MTRPSDILANNASIIVGLYRNTYGLQPKHNRLYLEPHLPPELNGTQLKYSLRGKQYQINLTLNDYAITVDNFTVRAQQPFGINTKPGTQSTHHIEYFKGSTSIPALSLSHVSEAKLVLTIRAWPETPSGERALDGGTAQSRDPH